MSGQQTSSAERHAELLCTMLSSPIHPEKHRRTDEDTGNDDKCDDSGCQVFTLTQNGSVMIYPMEHFSLFFLIFVLHVLDSLLFLSPKVR
jgi:hypothetical protein